MVERETVRDAPRSRRARLTAQERRNGIIDAALTEFARTGYQGASTASIARRAGCSEPMLYKHFTGKRDLFVQALHSASDTIQVVLERLVRATGDDVRVELRALAEHQARDAAYQDFIRLRLLAIPLADDPAVREAIETIDARSRTRIWILVRRGQEQGVLRDDVDLGYVAATWLALAFVHCYGAAFDAGQRTHLPRLVDHFIETISVST